VVRIMRAAIDRIMLMVLIRFDTQIGEPITLG
jgi:hypothetical protein